MTIFYYDDISLNDLGVIEILDDYFGTPERRGNNITIPFRDGAVHVEKYYDERTWLIGITFSESSLLGMEHKMDEYRKIFASPLQKTLKMVREDGVTRTVQAEVRSPINIDRPYNKATKTVLEFLFTEPYWRSDTSETSNTVMSSSPIAKTVNNPANVRERNPSIVLTGPLVNPTITNTTLGIALTYTGTIASPRVITIQIDSNGEFVATDDLSANHIDKISHSGSPSLMEIEVGDNSFSFTDDTPTTGEIDITWYPAFL